jgi:hypothetical protein
MNVRGVTALVVCGSLLSACAGTRRPVVQPTPGSNAAVIEYVRQLPLGTNVRVDRASERGVRGTLLKVGDQILIVQPRTRIVVAPVEIPLADVTRVTVDTGSGGASFAKAIGAGVAAGAAAALAVILIAFAVVAD